VLSGKRKRKCDNRSRCGSTQMSGWNMKAERSFGPGVFVACIVRPIPPPTVHLLKRTHATRPYMPSENCIIKSMQLPTNLQHTHNLAKSKRSKAAYIRKASKQQERKAGEIPPQHRMPDIQVISPSRSQLRALSHATRYGHIQIILKSTAQRSQAKWEVTMICLVLFL
jgi:hypothetical protein